MRRFFLIAVLNFLVLCPAPSFAQQDVGRAAKQAEPESASAYYPKKVVVARRHMVVAAHPDAAKAALVVLRWGGTAIDAAIAAQMVLNMVEPQSSGIGGGAFILYWDAKTRALHSFDGRETAPQAAQANRFMRPDGKLLGWREARAHGRAVGVPGLVAVMAKAHEKFGKTEWPDLFLPAKKVARKGFHLSSRLHGLLGRAKFADFGPAAQAFYFTPDGKPKPRGTKLKSPAFLKTLDRLAKGGPGAFYDPEGPIAKAIVARVAHPGTRNITLADIAGYKAKLRSPVCGSYRGTKICSMGPPSSGGLTVVQVLKLLEPFDLGKKPLTPAAIDLIIQAEKLAFADRDRYIADSDFVSVPAKGLLDADYLAKRRKLIAPGKPLAKALPGLPPGAQNAGQDASTEAPGTSHISIIDRYGNALSMTTTIESAFGSKIMAGGFFLNNELTDFSFRAKDKSGRLIKNRVGPGKRPRSSMAPVIAFDKTGKPLLVLGSPGGSRIIPYVVKALIAHLDWGLGADAAVNMPNFGSRNGPAELESIKGSDYFIKALEKRGHKVKSGTMTSGTHMIIQRKNWLEGGADPRRDGIAMGD